MTSTKNNRKRKRQRGSESSSAAAVPSEVKQSFQAVSFTIRSESEQSRFHVLKSKRMHPTRFICFQTLDELGMREVVTSMLHQIRILDVVTKGETLVYPDLTMEFLTTLTVKGEKGNQSLYFRMNEAEHDISFNDFSRLLGFDVDGVHKPPEEFSHEEFWLQITDDTAYVPKEARASHIHNVVLRYLHRVLTNTVFARKETQGVVSKDDLFFLWCMATGQRLNVGVYLIAKLMKTAVKKDGDVLIGGLISRIAERLGVVPRPPHIAGGDLLDMKLLMASNIIRWSEQQATYLVDIRGHPEVTFFLPNPQRITLTNKANWKFVGGAPQQQPKDPADTSLPPSISRQTEYTWTTPDMHQMYTYITKRLDKQDEKIRQMHSILQRMEARHISQEHYPNSYAGTPTAPPPPSLDTPTEKPWDSFSYPYAQ